MAINRSSFMGGGSGQRTGTISARGMRSLSTKDSIAMVKTLDAINRNLVSINNLLQKNALITSKKQEEDRRSKRRSEENLLRQSAESGFELFGKGAKAVGKFGKTLLGGIASAIGTLKNSLVSASKGILGGIADIAEPFVEFFTLGFIGWFAQGVMGWFAQNKEAKRSQIKSFIPKILTTLAVAGGVLLALQFGIPVIMGLIGTIVALVPAVIGTLLNPATWVGLLAVGTTLLGMEVFSALKEFRAPGSRARSRIEELREDTSKRARAQIEADAKQMEYSATGETFTGPSALKPKGKKGMFMQVGDDYFKKEDFGRLLSGDINQLVTYRLDKNNELVFADAKDQITKDITAERLREGKVLSGLSKDVRASIANTLDINKIGKQYQYFYKMLTEEGTAKSTVTTGMVGEGAGMRSASAQELKDAEEKSKVAENNRRYAQQKLEEAMKKTTPEVLKLLKERYGVTPENLKTLRLTQSETGHQLENIARNVVGSIAKLTDPYIKQAEQMFGSLKSTISSAVDGIAEGVSEIQVNINVKQTIPDMFDDPTEIPPPYRIDPYDATNPFLGFATKVYSLASIG